MSKILFANAHSLFDYTDGASNSIRLILEELSLLGHQVFVVTGLISNGLDGFDYSKEFFKKDQNEEIKRFKNNGINYSLVKTKTWQRLQLSSLEEELIYRETESIIKNNNISLIIGWGNLLLEESIFRKAKDNDIKICFYLVSPSYKGKKIFLIKDSDFAITDSQSTLNLYKNEFIKPIFVLPKFLEKSHKNNLKNIKKKNKYKCLFVNPLIKKGLEPFILISQFAHKNKMPLDFICINSNNNLINELSLLNFDPNQLPSNIKIKNSQINNYELFKDIDILLLPSLWHESGSRLICEAYSYGKPVIGFNTGGTAELIGKFKNNLFDSPKVYFDNNYILRLHDWNPIHICERINEIINNYKNESEEITSFYERLDLDINCKKKLNEVINFAQSIK